MLKYTLSAAAMLGSAVQARDGISYVLVGDFGSMHNLSHANKVFDAIHRLKSNASTGSKEDF
jgi:hypothetical protein